MDSLVKELLSIDIEDRSGKLHCSVDITDCLRHVQLRFVGVPTVDTHPLAWTKATTGTLWHEYFGKRLAESGKWFLHEIQLDEHLPELWSGRADFLVWNGKSFDLLDLKTTYANALPYVPKVEHIYQISAYYMGLTNARFPVSPKPYIVYLPLDTKQSRKVSSGDLKVVPVDILDVKGEMLKRTYLIKEYLEEVDRTGVILNDLLAPPPERIQRLFKREDTYELKLVPEWYTAYCRFPSQFCDCHTQGETKVGTFIRNKVGDWEYKPRSGYEDIEPTKFPSEEG